MLHFALASRKKAARSQSHLERPNVALTCLQFTETAVDGGDQRVTEICERAIWIGIPSPSAM